MIDPTHAAAWMAAGKAGLDLLRAQSLGLTVLEAKGRIQVRAHQVVLKFRRLIQRVQDLFASRESSRERVHEFLIASFPAGFKTASASAAKMRRCTQTASAGFCG